MCCTCVGFSKEKIITALELNLLVVYKVLVVVGGFGSASAKKTLLWLISEDKDGPLYVRTT